MMAKIDGSECFFAIMNRIASPQLPHLVGNHKINTHTGHVL